MSHPFYATAAFWKAASERAVKTFGQSIGALLLGDGLGVLDVEWTQTLSVAGLAVLASVASSLASGAVTDGSPSITNAETTGAVAKVDPASPTSESAGPASTLPDDTPTVTLPADPAQWGDQTYSGDSKTDATYHDPGDPQPGYTQGV